MVDCLQRVLWLQILAVSVVRGDGSGAFAFFFFAICGRIVRICVFG